MKIVLDISVVKFGFGVCAWPLASVCVYKLVYVFDIRLTITHFRFNVVHMYALARVVLVLLLCI